MSSSALCRCCLSQPPDKDLQSLYVRLGNDCESEVYAEMLEECFGINLSLEGRESDNGICDVCVARLRDARAFKHQVLHCQEEFQLKLMHTNEDKVELLPSIREEYSDTEDSNVYINLEPKEELLSDFEDIQAKDELTESVSLDDVPLKTIEKKSLPQIAKKRILDKKSGKDTVSNFTLTLDKDGTPLYTCNICQNVYKKRNNFAQHYKHVHLRLRPKLRSCHLCNVKVPGYMRAFHMEEHGLPAPSCGACGKKFAFPFQVLQHQKFYHMGEAEYRCEPCNLKFKSRGKYNHHLIKHKDEKAYKCELCDKSFKWKNGLTTHMLIHNNIRRHICHICQEAFIQQSSLKYHLMKKHPETV
ncbi:fez family zinc finger protein 2-like [Maniola hyperantus]|uniref:fez family zinc finger protein 2-like n=1 Tax=Aphantopus hyperantus TaxID=2795564 RepID=UPI0037478681